MSKLIWITAGNGFIGKNLIERLNKEKLKYIFTTKDEVNLLNSFEIKSFLSNHQPNIIIQTAGTVGGIKKNIKNRIELLQENALISFNLIKYAYENNVSKIINPVSSCIYEKNIMKRQKEKDIKFVNIEETNEAYSLSKYSSYKLVNYYYNDLKKNYINIIPSNIYGPFDNFDINEGHVIPSLINKFVNYKEIKLLGSGIAKRDFLYIEDFISAIILLIKTNKFKKNTFNVASNKIISIKNLVLKMSKIIKNSNYKYLNDGLDGNLFKSLDNKLISNLGWNEKNGIDKGLKQTIDWYIKNKK